MTSKQIPFLCCCGSRVASSSCAMWPMSAAIVAFDTHKCLKAERWQCRYVGVVKVLTERVLLECRPLGRRKCRCSEISQKFLNKQEQLRSVARCLGLGEVGV